MSYNKPHLSPLSPISPRSLPFLLTSTLIFIPTAVLLRHHVSHHGPFRVAPTIIKLNSRLYSLFSLLLFLALLPPPVSPLPAFDDSTLRYAYHVSKLYEYVDVFNVLAAGGSIGAHFGFHHLTTPYLTYVRTLNHAEPRGWRVVAMLNAAHHAIMYAYFGGVWSAKWLRMVLPWTGFAQLAVGIVGELYIILGSGSAGNENEEVWRNMVSLGLLACYFVLFVMEMTALRKNKDADSEKRDGEKK
ncbi:hypothetical protein BDY21DRAFT_358734 [Lineolata rhizophorae]|uniref:TLC domain-containing protein n=1 Tax=Lineolata rhizophorae TaxID=578093 RepID=A0A6A6NLS4_9PEZI|nr:hypothetical protein BDY21DRAFT_358734 [Lineolata rhizophorae]